LWSVDIIASPTVLIIPDRLAHYRQGVFLNISELLHERGGCMSLAGDTKHHLKSLRLISDSPTWGRKNSKYYKFIKLTDFYLFGICFWQKGLILLLLKSNYDVCVFWGEAHRISTWIAALICRLKGIKVVFWSHGLYGNEGWAKKNIRLSFYALSHVMLLYGSHAKNLISSSGYSGGLFVINNALDTQHQLKVIGGIKCLSQYQNANGIPIKEVVFVFIGRLEKNKELTRLVRVFNQLVGSRSSNVLSLVFLGDGPERQKLELLVNQLHIKKNVTFLGASYDENFIMKLLTRASYLVSPGNVGLSAMHSLIAGTPVVTHGDMRYQMPEAEVVINNETGFLFQRGSDESLYEILNIATDRHLINPLNSKNCQEKIIDNYSYSYQKKVFHNMLVSLGI
jgi:glycosyltransferase involved in cell wall biosynthesis